MKAKMYYEKDSPSQIVLKSDLKSPGLVHPIFSQSDPLWSNPDIPAYQTTSNDACGIRGGNQSGITDNPYS